jgi:hypothetical protein
VWNELSSKDIRNVLAISKLVHSVEDVSWLVQTFRNYGRIRDGIDNLHKNNWKKRDKLVGIGLISTSLILTLSVYVLLDNANLDLNPYLISLSSKPYANCKPG